MQFDLSVKCDNAAFEDEGVNNELAYILRQLADRLKSGAESRLLGERTRYRLMDSNGNTVGFAQLTGD